LFVEARVENEAVSFQMSVPRGSEILLAILQVKDEGLEKNL
jgi:hypothetical protein